MILGWLASDGQIILEPRDSEVRLVGGALESGIGGQFADGDVAQRLLEAYLVLCVSQFRLVALFFAVLINEKIVIWKLTKVEWFADAYISCPISVLSSHPELVGEVRFE